MDYIISIFQTFWYTLAVMSPYLLLGFLIAGIISVFISPSFVEKHLASGRMMPVVKASLFGVPLPLCSCGVIPVSMSLHGHGASKSSTLSFLLSTPQTGIDSVMVTWSLLGPVLAILRPIIAFLTGIFGGFFMSFFHKESSDDRPEDTSQEPDNCTSASCGKSKTHIIKRIFKHGFITLPKDIGKPMVLGLILAAAINIFVPQNFFAEYIPSGFLSMLIMLIAGMPVYVCSSASVPIAAAMIAKGLSPGAAMVFLISGPATNAVTLVTLWRIMGRKAAIVYLVTMIISALVAGIMVDLTLPAIGVDIQPHIHPESATLLNNIAALVLLVVLIWPLLPIRKKTGDKST